MPYDADLRCGYFSLEMNMSWFYEMTNEHNIKFEFLPTYYRVMSVQEQEDDYKDAVKLTIALFEKHIETAFKDWAVYTVFGHEEGDHAYERYDDVWEFILDITHDYCKCEDSKVILEDENSTLKKCSICRGRSSCGNYNEDHRWECEECGEAEDDDEDNDEDDDE
jgi:hypothetical protein